MRIIPYLRRRYETDLSKEKVLERIRNISSDPDWNFTVAKALKTRMLEGRITGNHFIVVTGKYALTYGRTSLLPVMKGEIEYDKKRLKTIVKIVIRPFTMGLLIVAPFYGIAIWALVKGVQTGDRGTIFFCCLFLSIIYGSILIKYNREAKNYIEMLEERVLDKSSG
ncbi:hypothetical protein ACX0G9_26500 [Flavitalea flava]